MLKSDIEMSIYGSSCTLVQTCLGKVVYDSSIVVVFALRSKHCSTLLATSL